MNFMANLHKCSAFNGEAFRHVMRGLKNCLVPACAFIHKFGK